MPTRYRIEVKEQLDTHWAAWFDGMSISHTADGSTLLEGGLSLIAVQPVGAEQGRAPE